MTQEGALLQPYLCYIHVVHTSNEPQKKNLESLFKNNLNKQT